MQTSTHMRSWPGLSLLLLAAAACGIEAPHQLLPATDTPNLTLYISNQSFAIDPVDIKVNIDGKPAVRGDFEVGSQHSWHEFRFRAGLQRRGWQHPLYL